MKPILKLILAGALLAMALPAQSQLASATFSTWVQSPGGLNGLTNTLSPSQVLEILSISMDTSSAIDVTANGETISFGQREDLSYPVPFVVAGPATVAFRRASTGGTGGMVTYRISEKPRPAATASR